MDKDKLLHTLCWMAGHTEYALTSGYLANETARHLRNTAREIIVEHFPKSAEAKRVKEFRLTNPDFPNTKPKELKS